MQDWKAYGAADVSSRMCLSLRSCGCGRCCKCFSSELERCADDEVSVSALVEVMVSAAHMKIDCDV